MKDLGNMANQLKQNAHRDGCALQGEAALPVL